MRPALLTPILLLLASFLTSGAPGQTASAPAPEPPTTRPVATQPAASIDFRIATWARLRQGALSLTFDDGGEKLMTNTELALAKAGIQGTFFVVTGWIDKPKYATWDQLRVAASHGHEIGSHTISHGYAEGAEQALKGSRDKIDQEIPGQRCVSIAYPSGGYSAKAADYYIAGRMAGKHFFYPQYPGRLTRVEDYIMGSPKAAEIKDLAEQALAKQAWACVTFHYPGDEFAAALEGLAPVCQQLWIAPMGQVVRYIREAQAVRVALVAQDAGAIKLNVSHDLDKGIFSQPLTLLVKLPADWPGFTATQADKPVWHERHGDQMVFEATPNAGMVVLEKAAR